MSVPLNLLEKLPAEWRKNGLVRLGSASGLPERAEGAPPSALSSPRALTEAVDWSQALLQGELVKGGVLEICSKGGPSLGTTLSLRAFRHAQKQAKVQMAASGWCAFVDPTRSLYAPGLRSAGLDPSRVLVVRPDLDALARVTLRLVESQIFSVVAVDLMGLPGLPLTLPLGPWVRVVRRLSLALAESDSSVVLLTDYNAPRPLPLPVKDRILVTRCSLGQLSVQNLKHHDEKSTAFVPRKALSGHVQDPSALVSHRAG